jgi:hypothetical protein
LLGTDEQNLMKRTYFGHISGVEASSWENYDTSGKAWPVICKEEAYSSGLIWIDLELEDIGKGIGSHIPTCTYTGKIADSIQESFYTTLIQLLW